MARAIALYEGPTEQIAVRADGALFSRTRPSAAHPWSRATLWTDCQEEISMRKHSDAFPESYYGCPIEKTAKFVDLRLP
jgi:hypothetical protein